MAKSMLVTLPVIFLLLDYWPLKRPLRIGLLLEKWPFWLLVLASATATIMAHRSAGTLVSTEHVGMPYRFARAALLYTAYIGKSIWPTDLAALYPDLLIPGPGPVVAAAGLLSVATAAACWGALRGKRWLAVGWFWYLTMLAPTIGVVQWGIQEMADRFMYLPQIGLTIALAWAAADLFRRFRCGSLACAAAAVVVLAALTVCSWRQTSFWRDGKTLWAHALCMHVAQLCRPLQLWNRTGRRRQARPGDVALSNGF